jgi:hypothetical protein
MTADFQSAGAARPPLPALPVWWNALACLQRSRVMPLVGQRVSAGVPQPYLGHKNIQHTVRYTEMAPTRFKDFWR